MKTTVKFPTDKEVERIRQLGKEKYVLGSHQNSYSEGFIDAVYWLKRELDF